MAKRTIIGRQEKYCHFCAHKEAVIDYKNTGLLKRYISSFGKIVPRKRNGLCARHQRKISTEIKRARIMALLPFIQK